MKQVDPTIYSGVDRAERRRIAKLLMVAKDRHNAAFQEAARLKAKAAQLIVEANQCKALAETLERENIAPPIELMACSHCRRPTRECVCDFDWA